MVIQSNLPKIKNTQVRKKSFNKLAYGIALITVISILSTTLFLLVGSAKDSAKSMNKNIDIKDVSIVDAIDNSNPLKEYLLKSLNIVSVESNKQFISPSDVGPLLYNDSKQKLIHLPTLMYHHIRDYINSKDILGQNLSVSPKNFDSQLQVIKKLGYTSITFKDLYNYLYNKDKLPSKPILITFDDGYLDAYINALPLLKKYGMKGSFAIITGFVDRNLGSNLGTNVYMTWDQIQELAQDGNEITSHTVNHPNLAILSTQALVYELSQSKKELDAKLNQNTNILIYPSGKFNKNVEDIAKKQGYVMSRTTNYGQFIDKNNLFEIPTIRMSNTSKII